MMSMSFARRTMIKSIDDHIRSCGSDSANHISFHEYLEKAPCTLEVLCSKTLRMLEMANDSQINRPGIRMTRKQLWEMPVEGRPPLRVMA